MSPKVNCLSPYHKRQPIKQLWQYILNSPEEKVDKIELQGRVKNIKLPEEEQSLGSTLLATFRPMKFY